MNECLEVTTELVVKIQEYLKNNNIGVKYKVWLDRNDREMGEPITLSTPSTLYDAIFEMTCSCELGGCIEVVTDNELEECIYHLDDEGGEYLDAIILQKWNII